MSTTADTSKNTAPPTSPATPDRAERTQSSSAADRFMRSLLRLPEGKTSTAAEARSAFQKSLAVTACRCLVMYIVLPFVLPIVGVASGVSPAIGLIIGVLAIVSITYSIRRFWRADHSKRWHYTVFGSVIIGFLVYLAVKDVIDLVS
jgi:threonine/homoserine/homoserine lactone efflux protein